MVDALRVALVGYGTGGRYFHAPFIEAADGIEIAVVVTRSPERRIQVRSDLPDAAVVDDLDAAISLGVDAAVITTPPGTRRELVLAALQAGLAVVADKPFAPDLSTAMELRDTARRIGNPLAVYYNRRWDADVRTLAAVLQSGELGTIERSTARMDEDADGAVDDAPGGGLLRDLGSHLVDQALWLFGPVDRVSADLDWRPGGQDPIDVGFSVTLSHTNGVHSHLSASKLNYARQKELRVLGTLGSYRSSGTDVQATSARAGSRPKGGVAAWGYEPREAWGTLSTRGGARSVPSERGAYHDFYSAFANAVRFGHPLPTTADDAVMVATVLDAARRSDSCYTIVSLS